MEGLYDGKATTEWFRMSANEHGQVLPGLSGLTAVEARKLDPRDHMLSRLAKDANPRIAGRETVNGDSIVIVEQTMPKALPKAGDSLMKLWINTSKGFAVSRIEIRAVGEGGDTSLLQRYDAKYKKYGKDIWALSEYVVSSYDKEGQKQSKMITKWNSDFQLNKSIDDDVFTLQLPSGLTVHNEVADKEYVVP